MMAYATLQSMQSEGFASEPEAPKDKVTIVFPKEALEQATTIEPTAAQKQHTPALEIQQLYYSDPGKQASKVINLTIKRPDGLLRSKTEVIPASAKAPPIPVESIAPHPEPTNQPCVPHTISEPSRPATTSAPPTSASLSLPCIPSTQVSAAPKP